MKDVLSVSVVVPTVGRETLKSTVNSILAQSYTGLREVIIVADTEESLDIPEDERIKCLRVGPRAGGNVARMAGIRCARGTLIALCDDDDRWAVNKLESQVARLHVDKQNDDKWVSSTLVREPSGRIWPKERIPKNGSIPEYLFKKRKLIGGLGALHTSTLLFPRSLVLRCPFDETLKFHQDTDWLLRLSLSCDVRVLQVAEPLTILGESRDSISKGITPMQSLSWALHHLGYFSKRVRGDFLICVTYYQALKHREFLSALKVLYKAFVWGRPGIFTILYVPILQYKVFVRQCSQKR